MKKVTLTTARSMHRSIEVNDDFDPSKITDEEWDEMEARIAVTDDVKILDHQHTWDVDGMIF